MDTVTYVFRSFPFGTGSTELAERQPFEGSLGAQVFVRLNRSGWEVLRIRPAGGL